MPREARDVEAALQKKGFKRREGKDAYYHLYVDGKKTPIFTKISHGEKEIHDGLLGAMSRQMQLSKRQFGDFVDCPLTMEAYILLLRQSGKIA